jgi:hypothetical protein
MTGDRVDTLTPFRADAHAGLGFRDGNAMLRAEALRQLHWQQRDWMRILATHAPGTPCLVAATNNVGINDGLDLLREAGEEVPARLYRRGSLVRGPAAAGGTTANVSLVGLVAGITEALEWFDPERSGQGVSSEYPLRDRYGGSSQPKSACSGMR